MKKLTKKEVKNEFDRIMQSIEDNDLSAFESVFQSGIDFAYEINQEKKIFGTFNELGYPINTKEILELLVDECPGNDGIYDELYGVNIEFTDISFNQSNSANRVMTIEFTGSENRGGDYTGCVIEIDSFGRVDVHIDDTPWESGGVKGEIIKILMEYVAKNKYL